MHPLVTGDTEPSAKQNTMKAFNMQTYDRTSGSAVLYKLQGVPQDASCGSS